MEPSSARIPRITVSAAQNTPAIKPVIICNPSLLFSGRKNFLSYLQTIAHRYPPRNCFCSFYEQVLFVFYIPFSPESYILYYYGFLSIKVFYYIYCSIHGQPPYSSPAADSFSWRVPSSSRFHWSSKRDICSPFSIWRIALRMTSGSKRFSP